MAVPGAAEPGDDPGGCRFPAGSDRRRPGARRRCAHSRHRHRDPAAALAGRGTGHADRLVRRAASRSALRRGLSDQLLPLADRLRRDVDRPGAGLYPTNCAACHGAEGRGDGPEATGLPVPPADLTADHLWGHTDGELFWWLSHGIDAPTGGGLAMPGFADRLSEDQRWALIDYIRAHNAGLAHAMTGSWPTPVQAPELSALCSGKTRLRLADLHGKAVRIVFAGDGPAIPPQDGIEVATIMVPPEEAAGTPSGCVAADPAVRTAYAAVAGTTPEALAGQEFLVDPNGWLRLLAPLGSDGDATDPQSLLAEIDAICRHPIESQGEPSAHHHHP
ncbi:MAG: cytochrome c [Aliidongia sp.]